jgi:hypothetical protein
VSGKALASGFSAAPEPVASAIPLSYFFADPKRRECRPAAARSSPGGPRGTDRTSPSRHARPRGFPLVRHASSGFSRPTRPRGRCRYPPSTAAGSAIGLELERRGAWGKFPRNTLFCGDAGFVGYPLWSAIRRRHCHFLVRVGANVSLLAESADCEEKKGGLVLCWPKTNVDAQPASADSRSPNQTRFQYGRDAFLPARA